MTNRILIVHRLRILINILVAWTVSTPIEIVMTLSVTDTNKDCGTEAF